MLQTIRQAVGIARIRAARPGYGQSPPWIGAVAAVVSTSVMSALAASKCVSCQTRCVGSDYTPCGARWKAVAARGLMRCSAPRLRRSQEKNRKDQTTGEKTIGRQQKKQCDATHAAEGWRGGNRDAGPRDCGTRRTGPGSVEITGKSSRLHDKRRRRE